jgi:hypothetical protein
MAAGERKDPVWQGDHPKKRRPLNARYDTGGMMQYTRRIPVFGQGRDR